MLAQRLREPLLLGGTLALGIAACSTDLSGPERPRLHDRQTKPAFTEVASELSVIDFEDGTQYTLNVPAREIRMSDGRVLVLDEEQTNEALEAFYGAVATDPVARDVETLSYTPCSTPENKVGCEDQNRVLPTTGNPPANTTSPSPRGSSAVPQPQTSKILWRRIDEPNQRELRRRTGPRLRGRSDKPKVMNSLGFFSFASTALMMADPCSDIANDAVSKARAYFNSRTTFVRDSWGEAVLVEAGNYAKRYIPRGYTIAAKFATAIANARESRIQVNILAFYWNSYSCSSRTVTAGPIFMGGGGGGGGLTCEWQRWEISFNGGSTWYPIWVRVCYAMQ